MKGSAISHLYISVVLLLYPVWRHFLQSCLSRWEIKDFISSQRMFKNKRRVKNSVEHIGMVERTWIFAIRKIWVESQVCPLLEGWPLLNWLCSLRSIFFIWRLELLMRGKNRQNKKNRYGTLKISWTELVR